MSTRECLARAPFRIRVKKSAMGSVVILESLPTGFHNAGNFSLERETSKTDAAHLELPKRATRASADAAAIALANFVFQLPLSFGDLTGSSHSESLSLRLPLSAEWHAEQLE
jgi:hypothetical protein